MSGKKKPAFTRQTALNGRPLRLPVNRQEMKDGKLYLTVNLPRPRWQQWLGADPLCNRTFGLDAYGQEVYRRCDGEKTVSKIIEQFSDDHRISIPEAETAVTEFLKTLMNKGLIAMGV